MKLNITTRGMIRIAARTTWLLVLFCFGLLLVGISSRAASITWGAATTIAGTNDVATNGTTKYAYNWDIAQTVNGVTFAIVTNVNGTTTTPPGNLTLAGFSSRAPTAFTTTNAPFTNLPTAYLTMLRGADLNGDGSVATITLNNLAIGTNYSVQIWVSDPRTAGTNRNQTVADGGFNSVILTNNTTAADGGLGQFTIGTFTADATNQSITITGTSSGANSASSQINAIQVRDLSPPTTATPTFSPASGVYFGAKTITVSSEAGSTVFYTTDGSTPNYTSLSGIPGSGSASVSISVPTTVTINAFATNNAKNDSGVTTATYTTVAGTTGTWTSLVSGSWASSLNWLNNAVPTGTNLTADFSLLSMTAPINVTNASALTIGNLLFDDQSGNKFAWTVSGSGTLTLSVNSGTPIISNNVQTAITTVLAGTAGLTKTGSGLLILSNNNSAVLSGTVTVSSGTLRLGTANSAPSASSTNRLGDANSGSGNVYLQFASGTSQANPITISSAAGSAKLYLDYYSPASSTLGVVSGTITMQKDLWLTNTYGGPLPLQSVNYNGAITGSGDLHVDTTDYGHRVRLNSATGNSFSGNVYINSGGLQITDSGGNVNRNVIPDTADVIMSANTVMGFGANEAFGALNGDATAIVGENYGTANTTFTMTLGANNNSGTFNGYIWLGDVGNSVARPNMPLVITKIGLGTQAFNGNCSNTAPTSVGGGTLIINSAYFASAVTVSNNATLGGTGILASNVNVQAGGVLSPGTNAIGTLTINKNLTLAGNLFIEVDKSQPVQSNNFVNVSGVLTNSGTGTVMMTNLSTSPSYAFAAGDKFTIFSQALLNGSAMTISPSSPGAGLAWTNNLAVDGSIGVYATGAPSTNAYLTSLVIAPAGTLVPAFTTNNFSYTAINTYLNKLITVTAGSADPGASLQLSFNGGAYGPLTSGVASSSQTLVLPTNTVAVKVTAADNATVQIYTVNVTLQPSQTPAKLTNSVSGSTLTFTWPADHLGWKLQMQTNTLGTGLKTTGWVNIPNTELVTQTNVSITKTNPTVFYRMTYP